MRINSIYRTNCCTCVACRWRGSDAGAAGDDEDSTDGVLSRSRSRRESAAHGGWRESAAHGGCAYSVIYLLGFLLNKRSLLTVHSDIESTS